MEIKLSGLATAGRDQRRVFDFSVKVTLKRPQAEAEPPKAAGAASKKS